MSTRCLKTSEAALSRHVASTIHSGIAGIARASTEAIKHGRSAGKPVVTSIPLDDLPQGLANGQPLSPLDEEPLAQQYPPVIRDARKNMQTFDTCVLLTRVGGFYELYFEHAEEYGPLLNLKVGIKKTSAGPVHMAGFPFFQLERYLKILVQDLGQHVALSEEMRVDHAAVKRGVPQFHRKVDRVVTPGTLIDEGFLSPYDHNYLLAIDLPAPEDLNQSIKGVSRTPPPKVTPSEARIGLAWVDLSSGDFFVQSNNLSALTSDVARISPKEILLRKPVQECGHEVIREMLKDDRLIFSYFDPPPRRSSVTGWKDGMEEHGHPESLHDLRDQEISAANLLVQYVQKLLPGLKLRLQAPQRRHLAQFMSIDRNSLRALEIHQTLRHNTHKGSLLHAIRMTKTRSGARLLARRLTSPSTSLPEIQNRLDMVEYYMNSNNMLEDTTDLLKDVDDTLRILQKISFGRGDAGDLLNLARTIRCTENIYEMLVHDEHKLVACISDLAKRFQWDVPRRIARLIEDTIDQEGLKLKQRSQEFNGVANAANMARSAIELENNIDEDRLTKQLKSFTSSVQIPDAEEDQTSNEDIWVVKRNASAILGRLHKKLDKLQRRKLELENSLRQKTGASSLSLKWTPGLGHICHVKGKDMNNDLTSIENARPVRSSKSTRSFYLPEWTRLGMEIEVVKSRIRAKEQEIFKSLRDDIIEGLVILRLNATLVDEIDVACSFARLALKLNLKRPVVNETFNHKVVRGRHLAVELGLAQTGRLFTPNHCTLDEKERTWLITGPNMAGKSTFLRQNALIAILAQTGSFVPAEHSELGIVDQVFSRVGTADNLSQDQSTFMVEMLETAYILQHATSRSLVIMDEVGRGTTPEDGTAVGYATLHHLHNVVRCRTLFATHYHVLADMTRTFDKLATYCTNVVEEVDGAFRFDHQIRRGVNREPHALKVALLAGVPAETIAVAQQVLMRLKPAATSSAACKDHSKQPKAVRVQAA